MVKNIFLYVLIPNLFLGILHAEDISLSLNVDKTNLTMEDSLLLEVSVKGMSDVDSVPQVLNSHNFEFTRGSSGSEISIINGRRSVKKNFSFVIYPKKEGTFTLGPAKLEIDGRIILSNKIQLNVLSTDQKPPQEKYYGAELLVSNPTPYVNEQVVITYLKFYHRLDLDINNVDYSPKGLNLDNIWTEDLGKPTVYDMTRNGIPWKVYEIKTVIYPQKAEEIVIPRVRVTFDVAVESSRRSRRFSIFDEGFFGGGRQYKSIQLATKQKIIKVKDLPLAGKPESFNGIVGDLKVEGSFSKNLLKVGESTTFTLTITGTGNMRDILFPQVDFGDSKVYDDKPTFELEKSNKIIGVKQFKKAIVPTKAGMVTIPKIEIPYFNPTTKKYMMAQAGPFTLQVSPSGEKENYVPAPNQEKISPTKKTIKVLGRDLMPLMRSDKALVDEKLESLQKWLFIVFAILCPLFYVLIFLYKRRKDFLDSDQSYLMKEKSYTLFKKEFRGIPGTMDKGFYEGLSKTFRNYLKNRFQLDSSSITVKDVDRLLNGIYIEKNLRDQMKDFLRQCEMGEYGGGSGPQKDQLKEHLNSIVGRIEKEVRK